MVPLCYEYKYCCCGVLVGLFFDVLRSCLYNEGLQNLKILNGGFVTGYYRSFASKVIGSQYPRSSHRSLTTAKPLASTPRLYPRTPHTPHVAISVLHLDFVVNLQIQHCCTRKTSLISLHLHFTHLAKAEPRRALRLSSS